MTEKITIFIAIAYEATERRDVADAQRNKDSVVQALRDSGFQTDTLFVTKEDFAPASRLADKLKAMQARWVFNLFEGFSDAPQYEAVFVEVLESLGIRYTGNPSTALRLCLDKLLVEHELSQQEIPVPRVQVLTSASQRAVKRALGLRFPVFVKPRSEDASVGIDEQSLVTDPAKLAEVVAAKLDAAPAGVLVEEFIPGIEYTVSLLGEYPYEDLGIASIDFRQYPEFPPFLTYRSKWDPEAEEFKKVIPGPAVLDGQKAESILTIARNTGVALKCRGYFRVDLRERDGEIFVLDVNPNPDLNEDSGFVRQAYARGYSYKELIAKIFKHACHEPGRGSR